MATLSNDRYEIRVTLSWAGPIEGIRFDFEFLWNGEPIVNDKVLKRINDYWDERRQGGFFVTEYAGDRPLKAIEHTLAKNTPTVYESIDLDFMWAFYPDMYFPFFFPSPSGNQWMSRPKVDGAPDRKAECYSIWFQLDTHNFRDEDASSGDGLGFYFIASREQLEAFYTELTAERQAIIQQQGVCEEDW